MNDIQSISFWKRNWVEALVMLPLALLVIVYSVNEVGGLLFSLIGLAILRLIYSQVVLRTEGRLGSIPKLKVAMWLFCVQIGIVVCFVVLTILLY
jgi:hypothetical protein